MLRLMATRLIPNRVMATGLLPVATDQVRREGHQCEREEEAGKLRHASPSL